MTEVGGWGGGRRGPHAAYGTHASLPQWTKDDGGRWGERPRVKSPFRPSRSRGRSSGGLGCGVTGCDRATPDGLGVDGGHEEGGGEAVCGMDGSGNPGPPDQCCPHRGVDTEAQRAEAVLGGDRLVPRATVHLLWSQSHRTTESRSLWERRGWACSWQASERPPS